MRRRITRSGVLSLAVCAAVLCAGLIGLGLGGAFDDDDRVIAPIVVSGAATPAATADARPDIVVDGGVPVGDARRAVAAAERRFDGVALTVDREDGRYEVELQRPDGAIVEVLVDAGFSPLGVAAGD